MEILFHTRKTEYVYHRYRTRKQAQRSLFEYIALFYSRWHRRSPLSYMMLIEYERYYRPSP